MQHHRTCRPVAHTTLGIAAAMLLFACCAPMLHAEFIPVAPYTADAYTLHLWHLDETSGTMADTGNGTTSNMSSVGAANQGASAYSAFGSSLGINGTSGAAATNSANVPQSDWQGADGAFTYEAMVNLTGFGAIQYVINRDYGTSGVDRAFQFRISSSGAVEIIKVDGGVESITAAIPTDPGDPNHFVANEWFHVAVTYDGNGGTSDNVTLYWTRVADTVEEANVIGSGMLAADLSSASASYTDLGNRGNGSGYNLPLYGLIDEVRVSSIARAPDDFIFQIPEPASAVLLGLAALSLLRHRQK